MRLRTTTSAVLTLALGMFAGCAPSEPDDDPEGATDRDDADALSAAQKQPRYERIRAAARDDGIPQNGYLLAGIANDETGLAMCWSEATWACQGPGSPDCGGGPVIAGSADGPCSAQQGGLGMFQFDAGTYGQTLAAYGNDVLTVEGQIRSAVDYVVHMVKVSDYTTNAETDEKALAWLNAFDPNNPTLRDQWIKTVVRYYNGCQPGWGCWSSRYQTYSDGLALAIQEPGGLAFWAAGAGPAAKPAPPPEGSQAFVYPNQQHFLHRDGAGNIRHHFWDGGQQSILTDTWGMGAAGQPVAFVHGTSQHVFARGQDGSLLHWFWDPVHGGRNDNWAPQAGIASDPAAIVIGDYEDVWAVDQAGKLNAGTGALTRKASVTTRGAPASPAGPASSSPRAESSTPSPAAPAAPSSTSGGRRGAGSPTTPGPPASPATRPRSPLATSSGLGGGRGGKLALVLRGRAPKASARHLGRGRRGPPQRLRHREWRATRLRPRGQRGGRALLLVPRGRPRPRHLGLRHRPGSDRHPRRRSAARLRRRRPGPRPALVLGPGRSGHPSRRLGHLNLTDTSEWRC